MKAHDRLGCFRVGWVLLLGLAGMGAGAAVPLYSTDFESGAGVEWSNSTTDNTVPAAFTRFSGRFGNAAQTLTVGGLTAGEALVLVFDLYILDSWDAVEPFRVTIDGVLRFDYTFHMTSGGTYPNAPTTRASLGFAGFSDQIHREIAIAFTPGAATATVAFEGSNLQAVSDESWGLDNVLVWRAAELPATVTGTSLPAALATTTDGVDRFTVDVSRPLTPASATSGANYELRGAGGNNNFGDGDDQIYVLTPVYTADARRVSFTMTPGPLQPGRVRFSTLPGLLDASGLAVGAFEREFTVANPVLGRVEDLDNGTLPEGTPLPLTETPAGSGFQTAYGAGTFQATGEVDYWSFNAELGDRVTVRLESVAGGINPRLRLRNSADTDVSSVNGSGSVAQIQNFVIPAPGVYHVRTWSDSGVSAYGLRVDLARGLELETEANDTQATSDVLTLTAGGGTLNGRVAGSLPATDTPAAGDFFQLGNLNGGATLAVTVRRPDGSTLVPDGGEVTVSVQRAPDGTDLASSTTGTLNHVLAADGVHHARIRTTSANLRAQYLLEIAITDGVAPAVTSVSLPAEGTSSSEVVDSFTAGFSEDMDAATVNASANYELRSAGGNGLFDGDDVFYSVAPQSYVQGLSASYLLPDGPLAPGLYRFTVGTGVRDRVGNPTSAPFVRQFSITGLPGWTVEGRNNGTPSSATSMGTATGLSDASLTVGSSVGAGNSPYDLAKGDLNGDGRTDLVVAGFSSHQVHVLLGQPDGTFAAAVNYAANNSPIEVEVGDVTGDGHADVVVANYYDNRVSVLAGDGTGTLGAPAATAVGANPRGLALANLNGAGAPEILVGASGGSIVSVLTRQPDGTYTRADTTAGSGTWGVVAGLFNGDAHLDVAVANHNADTVTVFLGDGTGALTSPTTLPVGDGPRDLAVGELTGDGFQDLAVLNANSGAGGRSVGVLAGNGDGTFAAQAVYGGLGSDPYHLALGDLNGDGRTDVAVAVYGANDLATYLNSAGGNLGSPRVYERSGNPIGVVAGDWNGDGRLDLATVLYSSNAVIPWYGNESRPLSESPTGVFTGLGRGSLLTVDDEDFFSFSGRAGDRVAMAAEVPGSPASSGLQYALLSPDGAQIASFTAASTGAGQLNSVATLPQDGTYLIRVRDNWDHLGEYRLRVTLARGAIQVETEANDSVGTSDVPTLDLVGDRQVAQIYGYRPAADNAGDYYRLGNLTEGTSITLNLTLPAGSTLVPVLEVHNAAGTAVATALEGATTLVHTVAGGADGAYFARVRATTGAGLLAHYVLGIELADLLPPVITSVSLPDQGTTSPGIWNGFTVGFSEDMMASTVNAPANYDLRAAGGDGDFDTGDDVVYAVVPQSYAAGLSAVCVIGDGPLQPGSYRFRIGTGLQDRAGNGLATAYTRLFSVEGVSGWVLEDRDNGTPGTATPLAPGTGTPDGSLARGDNRAAGNNPYDVAKGDLNGDGRVDLVVAGFASHQVHVLLGQPDGSFAAAVNYAANNYPIEVEVGDVNGDGHADVVAANYYDSLVSVLLGDGTGTLGAPSARTVGPNPRSLALANLNGTGVHEIVVGASGGSFVTVLTRQLDGTYARVDTAAGSGVWGVATGLFNADAHLDVVVANSNADSVSLLLGDGTGALTAQTPVTVGDGPRDLAVADLDGDGRQDVAVLKGNGGTGGRAVGILRGKGDGTFEALQDWGGLGSDPYHLALGDWNGDGRQDVAVAVYGSSQMALFQNAGGGVLTGPVTYSVPDNPIGLIAGDWNGDGRADLATVHHIGNYVSLWFGNEARPLTEDPAGVWSGWGRGALSSTADEDFFSFSGKAGDRVALAAEMPGNPGSSGLSYYLHHSDGSTLGSGSFSASSSGWGQLNSVPVLPADGTYYVRVRYNHDYTGEYRFRVTLLRGGIQVETESNDSRGAADVPTLDLVEGVRTGRIYGYRSFGDTSGDYFALGNLTGGTAINLTLVLPVSSTLVPILEVYDGAGTKVAESAEGVTTLAHTVASGADGAYSARVRAVTGGGLFAQYVLGIGLTDASPPVITSVSLPDEGTASPGVWHAFTVGFSEDMLATTVNAPENYDLRAAGGDGDFDTEDDQSYAVTALSYASGLGASYQILDGPLQAGSFRFRIGTGVKDRAGNSMAGVYTRLFSVTGVAGWVLEDRDNASPGTATPLAPGTGAADGSLARVASLAAGINPYDVARGDLNGDGRIDLVVAGFSSHQVHVLLGQSDGTFAAAVNYAANNYPIEVEVGDVTGDGHADVVVANYYDNQVSVLAGNGTGTLGAPASTAVGSNPRGLALANLNGAGVPELVVGASSSSFVTVLTRQLDGTYARLDTATGSGTWGVATGLFNADAHLDVVVANSGADSVSLLLGDGTGALTAQPPVPVGDGPRDLAVADLDGDGRHDVAVLKAGGGAGGRSVGILRGKGDGTFEPLQDQGGLNSDPYHLALGDWNGDGRLDVAVAVYGNSELALLQNAGGGVLLGPVPYSVPNNPIGLVAGDWNGDGRVDLATVQHHGNDVFIWLGNENRPLAEDLPGAFSGWGRGALLNTDDEDYFRFSGKAGDRVAVAVEIPGNPASSGLSYYLHDPDGTTMGSGSFSADSSGWGQLNSVPVLPADGTYYVRVRYNHDYRGEYRFRVRLLRGGIQMETENNGTQATADVLAFEVVGARQVARVAGYRSLGDASGDRFSFGSLAPGTTITLNLAQPATSPLVPILDILDGAQAVVAAAAEGTTTLTYVVPAGGAGTYQGRVRSNTGIGVTSEYLLTVELEDLIPPVIASTTLPAEGTTNARVLDRFSIQFGEEMLAPTVNDPANYELRSSGANPTFGDADDVVYPVLPQAYGAGLTANYLVGGGPLQPGSYRFTARTGLRDRGANPLAGEFVRSFRIEAPAGFVFENRSNDARGSATSLSLAPLPTMDGSFGDASAYNTPSNPYAVARGLLNADAFPDVVTANFGANSVSVFLGTGDGGFAAAVNYPMGVSPIDLVVLDLDGDGEVDVATADYGSASITIRKGAGDGTLGAPITLATGTQPNGIVAADFNASGRLDLATANRSGNSLSVWLQGPDGTFVAAPAIPMPGLTPSRLAAGDFNADGKADLAVAHYTADQVSVLLGDGTGGFGAPLALGGVNDPYSVQIADLDGNGTPDLVSANISSDTLSVWKGAGNGTFASRVDYPSGGSQPHHVSVADLDGDGRPELIAANFSQNEVQILPNFGDGTFGPGLDYTTGSGPLGTTVGDLNGDGRIDLVSADYYSARITVRLGNDTEPLDPESVGHELATGMGEGALVDGSDVDYWSFSGRAGHRLVLAVENPGNPSSSANHYRLENIDGQNLGDLYPDHRGFGQSSVIALPASGTYYVRVGQWYGYNGPYRLRVTLAPPDVTPEAEANGTVGTATPMSLAVSGENRSGNGIGYVREPGDLDFFGLGTVAAGQTIFLNARRLDGSTLTPVVSVYDAAGGYVGEAPGGRPSDTVAEVRIATPGNYFAAVRGDAGEVGGLQQWYIVETQTVPTASVAFPNLQVVSLVPPTGTAFRSGDPVDVTFTVRNVGLQPTDGSAWADRVVLSGNVTYGDLDDIQLGVIARTGALAPDQEYTVTRTLNIPPGVEGTFHVLVQTDSGNAVAEFVLEADNVTASETTIGVTRAFYPDLRVEGVAAAVEATQLAVGWNTANRGEAPAPGGFKDAVLVRSLSGGGLVSRVERTAGAALAVDAQLPGTANPPLPTPGAYEIQVVTDETDAVFEFDDLSHASAEGNNTGSQLLDVTTDLRVASLGIDPGGELVAGQALTIRWQDQNQGNRASLGSWSDRVQVINRTTGETLLNALVAHDSDALGALAPGGSHARERAFTLPTGSRGVGTIEFIVTIDAQTQVTEFATGLAAESNNASTLSRTSNWPPTPDLEVTGVVPPATGDAGQSATVTWTLRNRGTAAANGPWTDRVLVSAFADGSGAQSIGTLPFAGTLAAGESITRSGDFPLPASSGGTRYLVVQTDTATQLVELNELNNALVAPDATTVRIPDLRVTAVTAPAAGSAGQSVEVHWTLSNAGTGATFATWHDRISISTSADGSNPVHLGTVPSIGPLAAAGTVDRTAEIILPGGAPGNRYLVVETDITNQVGESDESNNRRVAVVPLVLVVPNLQVASLSAAGTAQFGAALPVTFAIRNAGNGPAGGDWIDRVWLSADNVPGGDVLLGTRPAGTSSPLAAGATTADLTLEVTLPASGLPPGGYFLFVETDGTGLVGESSEADNFSSPVALTLTPPPRPDLVVESLVLPVNPVPGGTTSVGWTVRNAGAAGAGGTWRDSVYLSVDSLVGDDLHLGTFAFTETLASGGTSARVRDVVIPASAPSGNLHLIVVTDAAADVLESDEGNNAAVSSGTFVLPIVLTVGPASGSLREGQSTTLTVSRTGNRAAALTVNLSSSDTTEMAVPASVILPAGAGTASFAVQAVADGVVDGTQSAVITARGAGFADVTATFDVTDAEVPAVTLRVAAGGAATVAEGGTLAMVVEVPLAPAADLVVTMNSSRAAQLLGPAPVTIPAGATSAPFNVLGVEDNLVEGDKVYTLTANAPGHNPANSSVTVTDNDVPVLSLAIAPSSFTESAGAQAATGTVTRDRVSDRAQVVRLETDVAGLNLPAQVSIPAGEATVGFTLGVTGNAVVDGNRTIRVRGGALESGGADVLALTAFVPITVTDDDGPTLRLALQKDLVGEGLSPATAATVSRNTATTEPLVVTLVSADPGELTVPATVTIPVGADSVAFDAASVADGVTDGNQTVAVTASAAGFVSGSDSIVVSDMNLPDLVVTRAEGPELAESESYVSLTYRVENQGSEPAAPTWSTRLFLSSDPVIGEDTLLGNYSFTGSMAPGLHFEQSVAIRMPLVPGDYWVVAATDVNGAITETLENNNVRISSVPIQVRPAYTATVSTDISTALAGTPIPMRGTARRLNGTPAPEGSLVNIHIRVGGTKRVISALVDRDGNFAATWRPLANEAGEYEIGAAHPGETSAPVQDTFVLLGMRIEPVLSTLNVLEGSTEAGQLRVINLSPSPLTGLALSVLFQPPNVTLTPSLSATTLPGNGQVLLDFTARADDLSTFGGYVRFLVNSFEGAAAEATVDIRLAALRPRLAAVPGSLTASVLRGAARTVEFEVENTGGRATGDLRISLPAVDWMGITSPNPIPSLDPGGKARVALQLAPAPSVVLGPYHGSIYLGNDDVGINVPYNFRVVSDSRGDFRITVVDEYTYYAEGAPKVADAAVSLRDPFTHVLVASGRTAEDGTLRLDGLIEGYYDIEVLAAKHTTYRQTFFVEPGILNELTAFTSRETVKYVWKVEPVEIEDHYKITVETEFETVVPTPVITVEPTVIDLGQITTAVTQVDLKITNHGLIQADNFRLNFPTHPSWEFTPLVEEIGIMPARSSLVIPVTIRKIGGGGSSLMSVRKGPRLHDGGPCHTSASATWELVCGPFNASYTTTISMPNANSGCGGPPPTGPGTGGGIGPGGGGGCFDCGPGGPGGGGTVSGPSVAVKIVCDPKCLVLAGLGCVPGPVGCFFSGFGCGMSLGDGVSALDVVDCAVGAAGCLIPPAAIPACIYAFARCFIQPASLASGAFSAEEWHLYKHLHRKGTVGLQASGSSSADPLERFRPGVRSMLDVVGAILGAGDSVWYNGQADSNTGEWYQRFLSKIAPTSEGGRRVTDAERDDLQAGVQPSGVHPAEVLRVIARWNRTMDNWEAGIFRPDDAPPGANRDFIDLTLLRQKLQEASDATAAAQAAGFNDPISAMVETIRAQDAEGESGGVCARVKLKLEQEAVITRDAFRASLEIDNQDAADLQEIEVTVQALDAQGRDASAMFGVHAPTLNGLSAVDGTGVVRTGSTGSAKWLIVPTVDAAPTVPLVYYIAGVFSYDLGGTRVRIPLEPVRITVMPTPRLWVKYFHQRDVFADDPFTDEIEPSIPYNLAVLVENRGYGSARNMRITSAQPQIVENEKGLLIDFKIIATEVAGLNITPSLTVNLGDIGPGASTVGRWLMTSTLQGLFTDYKASFEHVDGLNNPRLSLIEDLSIHEMIRLVRAGGAFEDGKPDFFVNQVPDPLDLGDTLYQSSGETNEVQRVDDAVVTGALAPGNLSVVVDAAMPAGWGYLRIPDPGNGLFVLRRVVRSDGVEIPFGLNVWTTDRTFVGLSKRPRRENLVHLLDHASTGRYTFDYDPAAASDVTAPESSVVALPASSPASFPLRWQGTDEPAGSGVGYYDVYVSENGAPPALWLERTALTSTLFTGQAGRQYAFFSRATDHAGNQEAAPGVADAVTLIGSISTAPVIGAIAAQETAEDTPVLGLVLPVTDPDTAAAALTVTAETGNATLLPLSGIVIRRTGDVFTADLTPSANRSGPVEVTIVATDGTDTTRRAFTLAVLPSNDPPVALADLLNRRPGGSAKIAVSQLLANDSDPEFDPLTVVSVSPASADGGTLRLADGWVLYAPPAGGGDASDSFTYRVSDGRGGLADGTVVVTTGEAGSQGSRNVLAIRTSGGHVILEFIGIPGRTYYVQATPSTSAPDWVTIGTVTANRVGMIRFTDTAPPPGGRFYRTLAVGN